MWVLDLISALAGLAALAFVLFGKRSRLPRRALWLLVGLLGVITLHGVSNTLERSGLTDRTDPAEDYIELFMPLLWGFFLYVFAEHEARGALRASERQKSAILQAINDHVVYHDADMRVVWANQAAADGAGLPVEELVGRTCYELWHGRTSPCPACPILAAGATGRPERSEVTSPDGRVWMIRAAPVHDDDGGMLGAVEVTTEVTRERIAAEALRNSEQRFRQLAELLPEVVFEMEPDGTLAFLNLNAFETLGLPPSGLERGTNIFDLFEEADRERAWRDSRGVLNGREPGPYEYVLRRTDGSSFPAIVYATPIRRDGRITGLRGIILDITARKESERRLRRERDFSRSLIQASPAYYIAIAPNGRVVMANEPLLRTLGYTRDELVDTPAGDLVHEEDRELALSILARLLDDEDAAQEECRLVAKDGRAIEVEWRGRKVRGESGEAEYVFALGIDLTERRRVDRQLRRAQQLEAVGRLAAGIAHDFNNQLTVVKGYCDLLLMDLRDDSVYEPLSEIRRASERATKLTAQLLAYSRKQVLRPEVIDPNDVLEEMVNPLGRLIGEDIRLSVITDPDAGSIRVDPALLQQAIMNLATNARDAMPNGGELRLEVATVELGEAFARQHRDVTPGQYVMIAVRDSGIGMSRDQLDRVFEPFYTTKEVGKGTGLGLSMVYGFVKQSGGHVVIESEPNKGTVLKIYLPRLPRTTAAGPETDPAPAPPGRGTILVVEDEEAVRRVVVDMLRRGGYRVLHAAGPEEGLRVVDEQDGDIDLLIADVVMPGMHGVQLVERLAAAGRKMRTLYISGYPESAAQGPAKLPPDAEFLSKPIRPEVLLRKVGELLGGSAHGREDEA